MKLCPQCEFLYEDDQIFCDMDGEGLVHDSRAIAFSDSRPAVISASPKHSRPRFMIGALLGGLLLSALLSLAYYASTRSVRIDPVSRSRQPESKLSQQIMAAPRDNSTQPAASSSPLDTASESPLVSADEMSNQSVSQSARTRTVSKVRDKTLSNNDSRLMISKRLAPLPQLNPLPQLTPPQRLPPAKPTSTLAVTGTDGRQEISNQTITETSQKSLIVEVKPESRNLKKQSRLGAFFKKTGRVLAKPFKR
jgi:hypothetical protein